MKEYIDKEDAIDILFAVFASHWKLDCSAVDDMIQRKVVHTKNKIKEVLAADVVSRAAFDQVMWERDVAIQQLREDYGVGLGEKKAADVVERKRGEWVLYGNDDDCGSSYFCSNCHKSYDEEWFYQHGVFVPFNACPNCFADMREVDHAD